MFELPVYLLVAVLIWSIIENLTVSHSRLSILLIIGGCALVGIFIFGYRAFRRPQDTHGSASFATLADISDAKLRARGMVLGKKGGRLIRFGKPGHLLTFAPTRSGKGVGVVIPNLLDHAGSVIVTDIKGENYRITAVHRGTLGPVHAFAPFDTDIESACYNPLDFIRAGTANDVDDARLIAEMIVSPEAFDLNHWEREARVLITGLLLHIASDLPAHRRNPRELRLMLMRSREGFDGVLIGMTDSKHPVARSIAQGFSQKEDKERSAVISTAQARTEIFDSPRLAAITARSTFRLEDLKNGVMSVFLIIPPEYVGLYQPFLRLMVGLATAAMTRNKRAPHHPVLFMLDELPALGPMRPIEEGIGYLAGYGAHLWLFVQDLDQLQKTYRKWRSMIANCAVRQAFNVQDDETARLLAAMLGQRTVTISSGGKSGRFPWLGLATNYSESRSEIGRPLLAPSEIMLLPDNCQLLFVQGCRPILGQKLRYYEERLFKGKWTPWRMGGDQQEERSDLALEITK
ncbi:conjugal transfer protein TraG [Thalassospira marina]|uniref:Conjugal transfer protein TraG n=2 Tax=Thalassospira marina TaxID=2048283 RepID=A0A2N3KD42_9PROT|nr:conjugal transfer protein TraG [Thalassospira marina]